MLMVWASLAADYLSIIVSSLSGKQAFLLASLLASRETDLKLTLFRPSIFEMSLCHDLIFREFSTSVAAKGLKDDDKGELPVWDELAKSEDLDNP